MRIACVTTKGGTRGRVPNGLKVAKALRSLGHEVSVLDHKQAMSHTLLKGVETVLAFGTLVTDEAKHAGMFAGVRNAMEPGARLALWYFDLCSPSMRNAPWKYMTMRRIAPALDWLVMTDHSYAWEEHVKRFLHLYQGVDPADFDGRVWPPEPRYRDVIFTGGYHVPFADRLVAINALKERFRVGVFGPGVNMSVYGGDFFLQYQRSRVAYVPTPPKEASVGYWSNRIYLAAATGTPCVVGYAPGLEAHYEDGKEVMFFHNNRELVQKTAALIADPDLRQRMGLAARERTLAEHTYANRCKTLMAAFGGTA